MNKLIGLGFDGPVDVAELEAVEAAWRERGEPVRAEVSSLAEPAVFEQLVDRGYRLVAFENVLGRALGGETSAGPVDVALAGPADVDGWFDAMFAGFAHPDGTGQGVEVLSREAFEAVMGDFLRADGFSRYVARLDGGIVGAASRDPPKVEGPPPRPRGDVGASRPRSSPHASATRPPGAATSPP